MTQNILYFDYVLMSVKTWVHLHKINKKLAVIGKLPNLKYTTTVLSL